MKKYFMVLLSICFILSLVGCKKNNLSNETGKEVGVGKDTITGNDLENLEEDLLTLSEEFAIQMATGEFSKVVKRFSPKMKKGLSQAKLREGWNTTVSDLGNYLGVYEKDKVETNGNINIKVILSYENNGIIVTFIYNKSGSMEGLWINYYTLEAKVEEDHKFEEIAISIGDSQYPLDGILTLPRDVEKPSVVILVHGSGTHDMDETIGAVSNKPFRDIAWGLAEKGIATIRYNERHFQYPELVTETPTIYDDTLYDVADVIDYAMNSNQVNSDGIYILGHSLGGMMAPKIAYDHKEVKGIISLAGSPRKLVDIILDQNLFFLELNQEITKANKEIYFSQLKGEIEKIENLEKTEQGKTLEVSNSYWYSLNQINTSEIVQELNIPMLIMQGAEDFQVYVDQDYMAWKELLGDRKNVTFHLYDNLNHLFMPTNERKDITEYNVKGTVDQKVIDDMVNWIMKYEIVK